MSRIFKSTTISHSFKCTTNSHTAEIQAFSGLCLSSSVNNCPDKTKTRTSLGKMRQLPYKYNSSIHILSLEIIPCFRNIWRQTEFPYKSPGFLSIKTLALLTQPATSSGFCFESKRLSHLVGTFIQKLFAILSLQRTLPPFCKTYVDV